MLEECKEREIAGWDSELSETNNGRIVQELKVRSHRTREQTGGGDPSAFSVPLNGNVFPLSCSTVCFAVMNRHNQEVNLITLELEGTRHKGEGDRMQR